MFPNKFFPFSRFRIRDKSMVPAVRDGMKVVTFNWSRIRKGNIIVFRRGPDYLIKRVEAIEDSTCVVAGDNKKYSIKKYNVSLKEVVGKVVYIY